MHAGKLFLILSIVFLATFAFSDGVPFVPTTMHIDTGASESIQLGFIDVSKNGYSLDLVVSLKPSTKGEDVYWAVPLKETPSSVDLQQFAEGSDEQINFKKKIDLFNSELKSAQYFQRSVGSSANSFGLGGILTTPLSIPSIFIISSVVYSLGAENAVPEMVYDFGSAGSAELFSIDSEKTLAQIFEEKGIVPDQNLAYYLDKKIVLFKLKRSAGSDEFVSVIAKFAFASNNEIYFPSGTTQYFKELPSQYAVMIKAPKNIVFNGLENARVKVQGAESQFIIFAPYDVRRASFLYKNYDYRSSIEELNEGVDVPKVQWDNNWVVTNDILLVNSGSRAETPKEVLAKSNPVLSGFIAGILILLIVSGGYLLFVKKTFSPRLFAKFVGGYIWGLVTIGAIFGFLVSLMLLVSSFSSLMSHYSSQSAIMGIVFSIVFMAIFGAIIYSFFFWKKNFSEWAGFSRKDVLVVMAVSTVLVIFVSWLISVI